MADIKELIFPFSSPDMKWSITCGYGENYHVEKKENVNYYSYYALDFDSPNDYGTPLMSPEKSKTIDVQFWATGFGRYIRFDLGDDYEYQIGHNATLSVREHLDLDKRQEVSTCGNTGNWVPAMEQMNAHPGSHVHSCLQKDGMINTVSRPRHSIKPEPLSGQINFYTGMQNLIGEAIVNPNDFIIVDVNIGNQNPVIWNQAAEGYKDSMYWVDSVPLGNPSPKVFIVRPNIVVPGSYNFFTHISKTNATSLNAKYTIGVNNQETDRYINQLEYENEWVFLGNYNLPSGTDSYVKLSNVGGIGEKVGLDAFMFTSPKWGPEVTKTSTPSALKASAIGADTARLEWTNPANVTVEYNNIYRDEVLVGTGRGRSESFTDSGLVENTEYVYFVKSVINGQETTKSNQALCKTFAPNGHYVVTPLKPECDSKVEANQLITITCQGSKCTHGHQIAYKVIFGDGEVSEWSTDPAKTHKYTNHDIFKVSVYAGCFNGYNAKNTLIMSNCSKAAEVDVCAHTIQSPVTSGPKTGMVGETLSYKVCSLCSHGHLLKLHNIKWGDGQTTERAEETTHIYTAPGNYPIIADITCSHNNAVNIPGVEVAKVSIDSKPNPGPSPDNPEEKDKGCGATGFEFVIFFIFLFLLKIYFRKDCEEKS